MLSGFNAMNKRFKVREETVLNLDLPENISSSHVGRGTTLKQNNILSMTKWVGYGIWTIWAFILMIIFGSGGWAYPDGSSPTCTDKGDKNSAMCGVIDAMSSGSKSLTFLSSFILGGFLLSTRQLWLTRRTAYCALCGATRNL